MQAPDIEWQKSLGGAGNDGAYHVTGTFIQPTADGGYIVAGGSNSDDGDVSGNHGGVDIWVVKLGSGKPAAQHYHQLSQSPFSLGCAE